MLYTPVSSFGWQVDNHGAANLGLNSPGHANANTKGATTQMLVGLAEDCYGIQIGFNSGSTNATIRRHLTDLMIDPAAGVGGTGSSWSVIINNLYANSPSNGSAGIGYWYYFPLYLKAGTAIATAHQDLVAGTPSMNVTVRCYGKPSHSELMKVGTKVQTLGADTSTTTGTAVTAGTSGVWGSYSASLGTLSADAWWWQICIGSSDTTMSAHTAFYDVAANATNKITCMQECPYAVYGSTETAMKSAFGSGLPIQNISSGQDVYVRGNCMNSATDASMTAVVYALS